MRAGVQHRRRSSDFHGHDVLYQTRPGVSGQKRWGGGEGERGAHDDVMLLATVEVSLLGSLPRVLTMLMHAEALAAAAVSSSSSNSTKERKTEGGRRNTPVLPQQR